MFKFYNILPVVLFCSLASIAAAQDVVPKVSVEENGNVRTINIVGESSWSEVYNGYSTGLQNPNMARPNETDPPALWMAYGYQLSKTNWEEGAELLHYSYYRARWDASQCIDRSAPQGIIILSMELGGIDQAFFEKLGKDKVSLIKSLNKVINDENFFSQKHSPWWICSHGMMAISSAMEGGELKESDWRVGEKERKLLSREFIDNLKKHPALSGE